MSSSEIEHEIKVKTSAHSQMVDVTDEVQDLAKSHRWKDGVLTVFCPHTTAGMTIQENADPDVQHDWLAELDRLVPWQQPFYKHAEGNSAAHVKSSLVGSSVQVILRGGELRLGTWQGIYFCEFDGPRNRKVWVWYAGAGESSR